MTNFVNLLENIRHCTLCAEYLPLAPKPILQCHPQAKILIAGQAPGRKAHEAGLPFSDVSGQRLRDWLGLTKEVFYDPQQIAILPMGFCYPGSSKSGDLPPRPECAKAWREQLSSYLVEIKLTLVIGQYAHAYYFPDIQASVTDLVKSWRNHWPTLVPLPHPSPRNNLWLRRNPWFERELLPLLQLQVENVLKDR